MYYVLERKVFFKPNFALFEWPLRKFILDNSLMRDQDDLAILGDGRGCDPRRRPRLQRPLLLRSEDASTCSGFTKPYLR